MFRFVLAFCANLEVKMGSTTQAPVTGTIEFIGAAADERLLYDRKEAARQLSISVLLSIDVVIDPPAAGPGWTLE